MNMASGVFADSGVRRRIRTLRPWQRGLIAILVLALIAFVAVRLLAPRKAVAAPPAPVVTVATPLARDVREWDEYIGRFAPSRTVEIRPRVSGEVMAVHFKDGEIVHQGQLLFTIDPRPFAAALAEAQANAASARSTLALARADLGRAQRLIGDEAISAGEVDALKARLQAGQAAVAAAEARVRARALDFGFTQVRAPISGRISDRRVDPGNQVAGGEGTGGTVLTRINALDPIYFSFDGSEALYLKMQRSRQAQAGPVEVDVRLQDETGYARHGTLDFTDNGLDTRSGTIRARAVVANPDYFLTPGMFGNMRLASGGPVKGLLVPDSAIMTDQARKTVLVVDKAGLVQAKPVLLGPVIEGLRIVRSGLAPTDRVIITGTQMAQPGASVTANAGTITPLPATATPPATNPLAGEATFASP